MFHFTRGIVVLAAVLCVTGWTSAADKDAVVLEMTTKLGSKAKVTVEGSLIEHPAKQLMNERVRAWTREPVVGVDLGNAVFAFIPLRLIKDIDNSEATKGQHVLSLRDGFKHYGKIFSAVKGEDGKTYELASVSRLTVLAPASKDPEGKPANLSMTVQGPGNKTFEFDLAAYPHLRQDSAFSESFKMILDGESLQANTSDFEKIALEFKDKKWQMTVKAPGAPEKAGLLDLPRGQWLLTARTANGCLLFLNANVTPGDAPSFTVRKKAAK